MSTYPSAAEINALPDPLRQYIHDLETRCDPAGVLMELALTKDHVAALEVAIHQIHTTALDDAAKAECEMCAANMELVEGTEPIMVWKDGAWVDGGRQSTFHHRIPDMSGLWSCPARKIRALGTKCDGEGAGTERPRGQELQTPGASEATAPVGSAPLSAAPDRAFLGGDKWGASSGGKPCGHHETNPCGCATPSAPKYVCPMKRPSGEPKNCGECRRNARNEPGECYCCGAALIPSEEPKL